MIETLKSYLDIGWVQNGLISLAWLAALFVVIFFGRKGIHRLKIKPDRIALTKKWFTNILLLFYGLLLVRIWAFSNLFKFFDNPFMEKLLYSAIAFGIIYSALYFIRSFINSLKISITQKHHYRKRAGYVAALIFVIVLIPIWAGTTQQWATVLSVMGAGIALALHEMLLNIAGWIYIMFKHPYRTGDRIEIGNLRGDVIDIQVFHTSLLELGNWVDGDQSTGRVVHMPHGQIFRNPLYNYTKGFEYIWNELPILITFESNWEKAKEIILKFGEEASQEVQDKVRRKIDKMAKDYLIYYKNFSPIVYTKIEDSGVKLTLRYLTEAKKRRGIVNSLSEQVLKAIASEKDVELAYPTYRIFKKGE